MIDAAFGLWLAIEPPTFREGVVMLLVVIAGSIVSAVPAIRAYRASVADGMMIKV
jgi:putative ABC transport system permease protein